MTVNTMKSAIAMLALGLASVSMTEARHGQVKQDPLTVLAFDVEDTTRFLQHHAERTLHPRSHRAYRANRALVRMDRLSVEARDFRRALQRFGPVALRTQQEFYELDDAFRRTRAALPTLRSRQIQREFRQLDFMMDDLRYRMERRLARYDRRPGHRYDDRAVPTRRSGSKGHVVIGKTGKRGHASVGFSWDDD